MEISFDIMATIIVERDSQKGIVIGKQGRMLKEIGSVLGQEIENLLGSKVFLELWVKVQKDWRNKATTYENLVSKKMNIDSIFIKNYVTLFNWSQ